MLSFWRLLNWRLQKRGINPMSAHLCPYFVYIEGLPELRLLVRMAPTCPTFLVFFFLQIFVHSDHNQSNIW